MLEYSDLGDQDFHRIPNRSKDQHLGKQLPTFFLKKEIQDGTKMRRDLPNSLRQ